MLLYLLFVINIDCSNKIYILQKIKTKYAGVNKKFFSPSIIGRNILKLSIYYAFWQTALSIVFIHYPKMSL